MKSLHITDHALDRFRVHHPSADWDELRTYLKYGDIVDRKVVQGLLERGYSRYDDTYVVSPRRLGIFVVNEGSVVTYLRLSIQHQTVALRLWPLAGATG